MVKIDTVGDKCCNKLLVIHSGYLSRYNTDSVTLLKKSVEDNYCLLRFASAIQSRLKNTVYVNFHIYGGDNIELLTRVIKTSPKNISILFENVAICKFETYLETFEVLRKSCLKAGVKIY